MPDTTISPYIIPPVLSLLTAYSLALVALIRDRLKNEKILLALVCIWWTMVSWAFISHQLIESRKTLLNIERCIHFFYVYNPPITILFFQSVTGQKKLSVIIPGFILSFLISLFVFTDYYFYGFHEYNWGLIAKTGPVFQVFTLYGLGATIYIFTLFIKKYREENNPVTRLKLNYFFTPGNSYFWHTQIQNNRNKQCTAHHCIMAGNLFFYRNP